MKIEKNAYDFDEKWDFLNQFLRLLGLTDFIEEDEGKKGVRGGAH